MHLQYLEKANKSLEVARWCLENKYFDDCANRCYYAILRAAVAALIAIGMSLQEGSRRIHGWVQANFLSECIRRRKIYPARIASYIAEVRYHREIADYSENFVSAKTASGLYRKAEEFVTIVKKELERNEL